MATKKSGANRNLVIILLVLILILAGGGGLIFLKMQKQTAPVPEVTEQAKEMPYKDEIVVEAPTENQSVTSPLTVTGKARGNWFFEGTLPVEIVDSNGNSLGSASLTAQGEWMTEEFVPFSGEVTFDAPAGSKGKLVIKNSNPSGEPSMDKVLEIPLSF